MRSVCSAQPRELNPVNYRHIACSRCVALLFVYLISQLIKYEFDLEFELPVSYPVTPFEIVLPELDGKTVKMYRGGKICLSSHFKPLWAKNVPHFGIAQALAMGVSARRNGTTQRQSHHSARPNHAQQAQSRTSCCTACA